MPGSGRRGHHHLAPTLQGLMSATPTLLPPTSSLAQRAATGALRGGRAGCRLASSGTAIPVRLTAGKGLLGLAGMHGCLCWVHTLGVCMPGSLTTTQLGQTKPLAPLNVLHRRGPRHPLLRHHWRSRQRARRARCHRLGRQHPCVCLPERDRLGRRFRRGLCSSRLAAVGHASTTCSHACG